jgi:hypothetical protein
LRRLGVLTEISDRSVEAIADHGSTVADSRPAAALRPISSSRPGSTIGLRPACRQATFCGLTSTPTTWCPSSASAAPVTLPT